MDGRSLRPVLWMKRRAAWIEREQGKHRCKCGCGELIVVLPTHFYHGGVPDYKKGHNPASRQTGKFKNEESDFWKLVDKSGDCWLWQGRTNGCGYGIFTYRGKAIGAHRLSFFFTYKRLPQMACHKCDTPLCVNPDHLFNGDQEANMEDAAVKGRLIKRYDPKTILKVVKLVRSGMTRKKAAELSGVSSPLACKILDGSVWSHLTGIPKKKAVPHGR